MKQGVDFSKGIEKPDNPVTSEKPKRRRLPYYGITLYYQDDNNSGGESEFSKRQKADDFECE